MRMPTRRTLGVPMTARARRWAQRFTLLVVAVPCALQWFLAYVVGRDGRLLPAHLQRARNLLVVTAHPDDECLFFAPSILGVLDGGTGTRGALLAMSTGNGYGIGDQRRGELAGSCAALGIDAHRCVALDHPRLQDDPTTWWDTELVGSLVREHVRAWDIDAIITFDAGGVSGHINHRAVSEAVRAYASSDATAPDAWTVTTTAVWRKYTILADLPMTALPFGLRILEAAFFPWRVRAWARAEMEIETETRRGPGSGSGSGPAAPGHGAKALVASSWQRYMTTRRAFASHASQYVWDRHLYMVLSRYVWFNDLKKVPRDVT